MQDPKVLIENRIQALNIIIQNERTSTDNRNEAIQKLRLFLQISQEYAEATVSTYHPAMRSQGEDTIREHHNRERYIQSHFDNIKNLFVNLKTLYPANDHDAAYNGDCETIKNAIFQEQRLETIQKTLTHEGVLSQFKPVENALKQYLLPADQQPQNLPPLPVNPEILLNSLQAAKKEFTEMPFNYGQADYKKQLEEWKKRVDNYLKDFTDNNLHPDLTNAIHQYCEQKEKLTNENLNTKLDEHLKNTAQQVLAKEGDIKNKKIAIKDKITAIRAAERARLPNIAALEGDKDDLETELGDLQTEKSNLEKEKSPLEQIKKLQAEKEEILAKHAEQHYKSVKEVQDAYTKTQGEIKKKDKEIEKQFETLQSISGTKYHDVQAHYKALDDEIQKRFVIQTIGKMYTQVRIHEYIVGNERDFGAKTAEQSEFSKETFENLKKDGTLSTDKSLEELTKHYNELQGKDKTLTTKAEHRRDSTAVKFNPDGSVKIDQNEGALLRALQIAIATGNMNLLNSLEEPVKKVLGKKLLSKEWRNQALRQFLQKIDGINVQWDMNIAIQQVVIALFILFGVTPIFSLLRYLAGDRHAIENLWNLAQKIKDLDLNDPAQLLQAYDIIKNDSGFQKWINYLSSENFAELSKQLMGRSDEDINAAANLFFTLKPDRQKEAAKYLSEEAISTLYIGANSKPEYRKQLASETLENDQLLKLFNNLANRTEEPKQSTLIQDLSSEKYFKLFKYAFENSDIETTTNLFKLATEEQLSYFYQGLPKTPLDNVKRDRLVKIYEELKKPDPADPADQAAVAEANQTALVRSMKFFSYLPEIVQDKIIESWNEDDKQKTIVYLAEQTEENHHQTAYKIYKTLSAQEKQNLLTALNDNVDMHDQVVLTLLQQAAKDNDPNIALTMYLSLRAGQDEQRMRVTSMLDVDTATKVFESLLTQQNDQAVNLNMLNALSSNQANAKTSADLFSMINSAHRPALVKNILANESNIKIKNNFSILVNAQKFSAAMDMWLNLPDVKSLDLIQNLQDNIFNEFAEHLLINISDEKNVSVFNKLYAQSTNVQKNGLVHAFLARIAVGAGPALIRAYPKLSPEAKRDIFTAANPATKLTLAKALVKDYAEKANSFPAFARGRRHGDDFANDIRMICHALQNYGYNNERYQTFKTSVANDSELNNNSYLATIWNKIDNEIFPHNQNQPDAADVHLVDINHGHGH